MQSQEEVRQVLQWQHDWPIKELKMTLDDKQQFLDELQQQYYKDNDEWISRILYELIQNVKSSIDSPPSGFVVGI